jgi:hypothetical protein
VGTRGGTKGRQKTGSSATAVSSKCTMECRPNQWTSTPIYDLDLGVAVSMGSNSVYSSLDKN